MPTHLTCRSGHRWELTAVEGRRGTDRCPVCGSDAQETDDPHATVELYPVGGAAPEPPDASASQYPPRVRGYAIYQELARGGTGTIFQSLQIGCQRLVALKVLSLSPTVLPRRRERFRHEVELLARLDHPHIVPLYDAGESDGHAYYTMKLLAHGSLRDRLRDWPEAVWPAAAMLAHIAEAVHHVHGKGVIHGDLKPGNILFDDRGEPYLCDFGLARQPGRVDGIVGTPAYMAPEQAESGSAVDAATDVYALGVILYEVLTGQPPFRAGSAFELFLLARETRPHPPRLVTPDCPPALEELCLHCLASAPADRPSAGEVADRLRDALAHAAGEDTGARPRARPVIPAPPRPEGTGDVPDHWLRAGLDAMAEGVLVLDAAGKVVRSNPEAVNILGRDLTGLSLPDWVACQKWLRADAVNPLPPTLPTWSALRGQPAEEVEVFLPPGDGGRGGWVLLGARPLTGGTGMSGAVVVFRDVTLHKGLFKTGQLYHSLLDLLGLNMFRKDLQGRYTFATPRFCTAVGRRLGQVLGCTDFDLFSDDLARQVAAKEGLVRESGDVEEYIEEHNPALCGRRCRCTLFREPQTGTGGDGAARYFQMLLAPLYDDERRVAGIQGAFWDITGRRRAERQLEQTAEALECSNADLTRSNEDLQQFAYAASHDLQEPLRMVSNFTRLLQKKYQGRLDDTADQYIHFAVDGAVRMQRLVNDLLAYARVGSRGQPPQDVCTAEACDRAVQNLREAVRDGGAAVTRDPLPLVRGDATQLMQLFQNLIDNALKFRGAAPPAVHVSARRDAAQAEWVFSVQDNGIGIEPRHLERIFAIFQRLHTQQEYPGSGIGLAVCRRIVERHRGRIWAESEPGKGSVFRFTLPAGQEETP
jgi:signal transduction histidine kinase